MLGLMLRLTQKKLKQHFEKRIKNNRNLSLDIAFIF